MVVRFIDNGGNCWPSLF